MMEKDIIQAKFDLFMREFKKQSPTDKKMEIINSLKELIEVLDMVCQMQGINVEYVKSLEINDLNTDYVSEDDFLEGCLVYIENVKNIISQFLIEKSDIN